MQRNRHPAYFECARDFTLCDHYFSEIADPSTPNHLMLICTDGVKVPSMSAWPCGDGR
ncbi:MAG: hypothetical protein JOZ29_02345 [Deltaproteobacteria bacterium]|nr:hypothetical protein [Deltaproteobacteria bacterium]